MVLVAEMCFVLYAVLLSVFVQGGLTATDVFAVEWIQTGVVHYGTTVSYFGFLSDGKPFILRLSCCIIRMEDALSTASIIEYKPFNLLLLCVPFFNKLASRLVVYSMNLAVFMKMGTITDVEKICHSYQDLSYFLNKMA